MLRSIHCRTDIHLPPPALILPPDEIPRDIDTSVDLKAVPLTVSPYMARQTGSSPGFMETHQHTCPCVPTHPTGSSSLGFMETSGTYLPMPPKALYCQFVTWVYGNPISLPALASIGRFSEAGLLE